MKGWHAIAYAILIVSNAGLVQLALDLGAGRIPVPAEWAWLVPTTVAALTALTTLLPRVSEPRG